ncbi:tRNA dihydrouridine synthase [Deinococcus roseus]|uniref:tRNA-dihydrouridine synthase n=1 Tax=Deinococcus roseus TaxID=392414 RepID=A0ABQ2D009_9DEIO|nr:tRNA-dihydrouridine synthase family protein [Deinococcus roseus]GGJ26284.1 nifR3 protein [Deinococcus roseus]
MDVLTPDTATQSMATKTSSGLHFYADRLKLSRGMLAPMAGYTDAPFRKLARSCGAAWAVSEMMSAQGVLEGGERTLELGKPYPGEEGLVLQLFGADPEVLSDASRIIEQDYAPAALDLNMGCPVPKMKGRGGACLLQTPEVAFSLVSAMKKATTLPISAKMRIGWDSNHALEIALGLQEAGADLIAVHGRTSAQRYEGHADWDTVAEVAHTLQIPVIGSGDVKTAQEFQERLQLGVAGVMVGRGAVGNPWIFSLVQGKAEPTLQERCQFAIQHAELNALWYGEHTGIRQLRKVLWQYFPHHPELKPALQQVGTVEDVKGVLGGLGGFEIAKGN